MNESSPDKITTRLKEARLRAGLTQGQVAKLIGLHRPSVSEIEAGRRSVTAEELKKLSDIYSCDIRWLTGSLDDEALREEKKVQIAARELSKLKPQDIDQLLSLLASMRSGEGDG